MVLQLRPIREMRKTQLPMGIGLFHFGKSVLVGCLSPALLLLQRTVYLAREWVLTVCPQIIHGHFLLGMQVYGVVSRENLSLSESSDFRLLPPADPLCIRYLVPWVASLGRFSAAAARPKGRDLSIPWQACSLMELVWPDCPVGARRRPSYGSLPIWCYKVGFSTRALSTLTGYLFPLFFVSCHLSLWERE